MSNLKRPIPERVVVSGPALARLINALNGSAHLIRELQAMRVLDYQMPDPENRNPINVIEDELMAIQRGEGVTECPYAGDEDYSNCALFNHRRIG